MSINCRALYIDSEEPIPHMFVSLRCLDSNQRFEALTDEEGKVSRWFAAGKGLTSIGNGSAGSVLTTNNSSWILCFYAGPFLQEHSPFPRIHAEFHVHQKAHHNFNLLLDDDSYSIWDEVTPLASFTQDGVFTHPGIYLREEADFRARSNAHKDDFLGSPPSVLPHHASQEGNPGASNATTTPPSTPPELGESQSERSAYNETATALQQLLNQIEAPWPSTLVEATPESPGSRRAKRRADGMSASSEVPPPPTKHRRIGVATRKSLRLQMKNED